MIRSILLLNKLSLYWKCQIIGWLLFSTAYFYVTTGNDLEFDESLKDYVLARNTRVVLSLMICGLIVSHIMKVFIKQTKILRKPFNLQIVLLLATTVLFTLLFLFPINFLVPETFYFRYRLPRFLTSGPLILNGLVIWNLIYFMYHYVKRSMDEERQKTQNEKDLLDLEAKALRARMNPHFIFNCLNSIKALIQVHDSQKSIDYLTTFSKFIRTLLYTSDKRRITLFEEIENCKLYTQLEAMRLNGKLSYSFVIDDTLDFKSVMVPALVIQPFIENAIWHGIVPKGEGSVIVNVNGNNSNINCEIEDNGIGRKLSMQNKPAMPKIYESQGIDLSLKRLQLEKLLNESNAYVETFDKYENETPLGTKVILRFNLQ